MYLLEQHVRGDPLFSLGPDEDTNFRAQLSEGLRKQAMEVYTGYFNAEIPNEQDEWQFYHVVQLGQAVLKLAERIQKRYKKNPEIMG
jgi:hypothetical protein